MVTKILSVFPIFKITFLILWFIIEQNDLVFLYSTSFIAVAFLVRFIVGNPYSITRKLRSKPHRLSSYYFILALAGLVAGSSSVFIQGEFKIVTLILASKLLETLVVALMFYRVVNNNQGRDNFFVLISTLIVFEVLTFGYFTFNGDLNLALMVDLCVLLLASGLLIYSHREMVNLVFSTRLFLYLFRNNLEIALTVLPVSILMLFFLERGSSVGLVGYVALAFSIAGFLNRPISYFSAMTENLNYNRLISLSYLILVFTIILLVFDFNLVRFEYVVVVLILISILIQNLVRLHLYAHHHLNLSYYHTVESIIVLSVSFMFDFNTALIIFLITRAGRLSYIQKYA